MNSSDGLVAKGCQLLFPGMIARQRLGWQPTRTDLAEIIRDAWTFAQSLGEEAR